MIRFLKSRKMADQNSGQASSPEERLSRFSKENRWYYKSLDNHVPLASRKLLEEYSHIPPSKVDSHIYKMVLSLFHFFPLSFNSISLPNQLTSPSSATSSGLTPLSLVSEDLNSSHLICPPTLSTLTFYFSFVPLPRPLVPSSSTLGAA